LGVAPGVEECARTGKGSLAPTFVAGEGVSLLAERCAVGVVTELRLEIQFPIWAPMDEDGFANIIAGDELRSKTGRNGSNIMTPFQCNICQFCNIKGREPNSIRLDD
jgi:hypothetical protein